MQGRISGGGQHSKGACAAMKKTWVWRLQEKQQIYGVDTEKSLLCQTAAALGSTGEVGLLTLASSLVVGTAVYTSHSGLAFSRGVCGAFPLSFR